MLLLLLADLLAQFRVQLHLLELFLLTLGIDDLVLHGNLLLKVLFLHLLELIDADQSLFVAGQSLTHGQLILIL